MRKLLYSRRLAVACAAFVSLAAGAPASGQQPARPATGQQPAQPKPAPAVGSASKGAEQKSPAQQPAAAQPKGKEAEPSWRLNVSTKETPAQVSLTAKDAPLAEIAADLARKLKVPVILSRVMLRQKVSHDFKGIPLEGAVRMLAPQVYVDYEVSGDASTLPKPIGIYLHALNEEAPEATAVVKGDNESVLIEGHTEEGTEEYEKEKEKEESPLRVKVEKNMLSVRARKQPLLAVLAEIAGKVDIPFEMKYESSDLVDVDFSNYAIDQAVRALSPNIRLYMRTDLSNYEIKPLRLVLMPPAGSQQSTRM